MHEGQGQKMSIAWTLQRKAFSQIIVFSFGRSSPKKLAQFNDRMHEALKASLVGDTSTNEEEVKAVSSCADNLFNNLQAQVMCKKFHHVCQDWAMSPHHDESAGIVLLAWQLVGAKQLVLLSDEGVEHSLQWEPGHLYISNVATAFHQVPWEIAKWPPWPGAVSWDTRRLEAALA